ncbi:MAG: hypothetical protein FIA82_08135 [Melioribacter sp.]|nr:hypothetical protein [Melioribacter sp.]
MKKNIWLLVIGFWLLVAGGRWPVVNAQTYDHSAGTSYPSFRIGVDPYLDFQPTADTGLVKIELNGYVKYLATKGWVLQHIATGSGIKHLNGLSDSTQTFAIDTSGTDFAITSASTIHTFKLPFATAVNHGKLRSTDWTKFNNKENALTFSYPLVRTVNAISLSYNSTNLKQTSNQLNTIQDIATTSSPTFSNVTATNDLTAGFVNSNLIPKLTDTYDLGSSTKLWRKGWLSEMEAILFAKETITLLGGWFYVTKDAGTLPADVNTSQTTIDFGKAMTTNDIFVFRQPLTVE